VQIWTDLERGLHDLLLLLLGAFLGFALTGLQAYLDRRRRRKSLATALLIELRWLEYSFRNWYKDEQIGNWPGTVPMDVYDRFSSELLLLRSDRFYAVQAFYSLVEDLRRLRTGISEKRGQGKEVTKEDHHIIRVKCAYALELMAAARRALEAEGGRMPTTRPTKVVHFPELPPLPPELFPDEHTSQDDSPDEQLHS
jgi:hypothetical protein